MSHDTKFLNDFGEDILEMDKPALYAYSSGVTDNFDNVHAAGAAAAITAGYSASQVRRFWNIGPYTVEFNVFSQVAAGAGTYTEIETTTPKALAHPDFSLQIGDLIFYDVDTFGLLCSYMMFNHGYTDLTPLGGFGICEVEGANNIAFTVVSIREPVASPPEDFAMQLFDASGGRLFDSRQPLFEIYDHYYISKQIMERILRDGITVNFNLSESHASFRVSAPNHFSFITFTGGYRAQVAIKKVDNDTFSLSRIDNGGAQTGTFRELFRDTSVIIGR